MYVDLDSVWFEVDLKRFDVDAELHGAIVQKLLAKSFHYPWIQGQRGARRGSIRRVGPFSELEVHHRAGVRWKKNLYAFLRKTFALIADFRLCLSTWKDC